MLEIESCICGFHVYYVSWTPREGEVLHYARKIANREDPYAVAVKAADNDTVGHVPRKISCICWLFIRNGGTLTCTVTGKRRRSEDLPQGGLEIPCLLKFEGSDELVAKVKNRLGETAEGRQTGDMVIPQPDEQGHSEPNADTETPINEEPRPTIYQKKGSQLTLPVVAEGKADDNTTPKKKPKISPVPPSPTWLTFQDIVLSERDRNIIESGNLFEDQHMNFVQRLLKQQFPQFNGLRLTLLQKQPHSEPTTNALQILHIKGNHWVVATTKVKGKAVYVYDTLFSSVDQATAGVIKTNFRCNVQNIQLLPCQKQVGGSECGPFAIAIATSIAFGEDPSKRIYAQDKMRNHIVTCFVNKQLQVFP